MGTKGGSGKGYLVHSLERGLEILEALAAAEGPLCLKELCQRTGFNPSTAHRILMALKARGYVRQEAQGDAYLLSFKLFELGSAIVRRISLRREARPFLERIARLTGESTHLNLVDNDECLCLERVEGHHAMQVFLQEGGRIPLYVGAGPRVLLAFLPDAEIDRILATRPRPAYTDNTITSAADLWKDIRLIRQRGYAQSASERTPGAASLGWPVYVYTGGVKAGLSITGYFQRFEADNLPRLLDIMRRASQELSARLGANRP